MLLEAQTSFAHSAPRYVLHRTYGDMPDASTVING
jgi:hypothetical protein